MALAMVFSLSVTAFAAGDTGSITITNATINETYEVYKIFDASISKDKYGNTEAVAYSIATDNQFFKVLFGADGENFHSSDERVSLTSAVEVADCINAFVSDVLSD